MKKSKTSGLFAFPTLYAIGKPVRMIAFPMRTKDTTGCLARVFALVNRRRGIVVAINDIYIGELDDAANVRCSVSAGGGWHAYLDHGEAEFEAWLAKYAADDRWHDARELPVLPESFSRRCNSSNGIRF